MAKRRTKNQQAPDLIREFSGDRPTGTLERLCYERHFRDLEVSPSRGLWFDERAANHAITFCETYLKHGTGQYRGAAFILSGWERFIVASLFGWMILPRGITPEMASAMSRQQKRAAGIFRRFRDAYIEIARKNGKTELLAAIGLYMLIADGEFGAEVYSGATKYEQASIVFRAAKRMVRQSPDLLERAKPLVPSISVPALDAFFKPVGADHSTLDGLNLHCGLVDELHAHPNRELWDVLATARGSRQQPMMLAITTAGVGQNSFCWEQRQDAEKILHQVYLADSFFVFIACADENDDWQSWESAEKANPNLNISVKPEYIKDALAKAQRSPAFQNNYRRYHLCQWVEQTERWMPMEKWRECEGDVDEAELAKRSCYAGLDLSKTTDLTALVLVFPPPTTQGLWYIKAYSWIPSETVLDHTRKDRVPFEVWAADGHILLTPGNVVDYDFVQKKLEELSRLYKIKEIGFDPWNATKFSTDMQTAGFKNLVEVRQGHKTLSPAMSEVERLILQRRIVNPRHPVMTWCLSNVTVRYDANNNMAPDKVRSTERIDLVSALVTAMSRAILNTPERESYYKTHGVTYVG